MRLTSQIPGPLLCQLQSVCLGSTASSTALSETCPRCSDDRKHLCCTCRQFSAPSAECVRQQPQRHHQPHCEPKACPRRSNGRRRVLHLTTAQDPSCRRSQAAPQGTTYSVAKLGFCPKCSDGKGRLLHFCLRFPPADKCKPGSSLTSEGVSVPAKVNCSTYGNLWLMPMAAEGPQCGCHSVAGMNLKGTVPNLKAFVDLQAPGRGCLQGATLSHMANHAGESSTTVCDGIAIVQPAQHSVQHVQASCTASVVQQLWWVGLQNHCGYLKVCLPEV